VTSQPLFDAIRAGDLEAVDRIVGGAPELAQASDASGLSALTVAAYHGRWPIVDRLLATDPDLDLFEAAIVGDAERVRARLDEAEGERDVELATGIDRRAAGNGGDGADGGSAPAAPDPIEERSPDGFSALHYAAFFGRPAVARLLLARGADPNAWATGGQHVQPLHSAVAGGHQEVAALLVAAGADVDARQDQDYTPLMGAAQGGLAATVDLLLAQGADPKAHNVDILTAAELADRAGHAEVAATIRAAIRAAGG
jgi:ankyrin repeat protein